MSLALMMLLTGPNKNILHNFTPNSCNNSYMTLWAYVRGDVDRCDRWKGARYQRTAMYRSSYPIEQTC